MMRGFELTAEIDLKQVGDLVALLIALIAILA